MYNSTSTFGVCSQPMSHSFARTKPGLHQDYCICIIRDCVPRTSVRHTRARTMFALFLPCHLSSAVTSPIARPPSSSSENSTRVTLHLASVSRAVGSYSRRFERTRDDTVSPFLPLPLALSCPDLSLFIRSMSFQGRKRLVEAPRNRSSDIRVAALRFATRKIDIHARILG